MDRDKKLKEIFENDPFGLLNVKAATPPITQDERLASSFREINEFYEKNKREPDAGNGVQEYMLYTRLKSLRENEQKLRALEPEDKYGLLKNAPKKIVSLDDVLSDDKLGILSSDADNLFVLKNVPKIEERDSADFVARRKPCKEFEKYEALFKACQQDLKSGKRKLIKFHENQINEGAYFVHNGILLCVAKLFEMTVDKEGKRDGRTLTIFENGTESNLLFRSLGKALFDNGHGVTATDDEANKNVLQNLGDITQEDVEAGFIYVLKSRSGKEEVSAIKNLYKIGYSKIDIAERIKNAEQEPTYLMAPVAIVTAFQCYNMNPQKLEQLLHNFFGNSCLNIDVFDKDGRRHTPREWFIAPLELIEQAISFIISGEIVKYRYDSNREQIVAR